VKAIFPLPPFKIIIIISYATPKERWKERNDVINYCRDQKMNEDEFVPSKLEMI